MEQRPQRKNLQEKSDQDWMQNNREKETNEGHPHTSRKLPQKGDVKSQTATDEKFN